MTPSEIKAYLDTHYPELVAAPLPTDGKGFSFFLGARREGRDSNRILRASNMDPNTATKVKPAVSYRLDNSNDEFDFSGGPDALRRIVDREIALFRAHFQK